MTHDDQAPRIHSCGRPMTPSVFGPHEQIHQYRSQPIWLCGPCDRWEPSDGWHGPLPEGWDGSWARRGTDADH